MNKNEIEAFIAREKKENNNGYLLKSFSGSDFTTGENGTISGYFATFDHDHGDSYGDVIKKGAFAGTITRRKKTGHPFPLCFNHDFSVIIGRVTDIGEDNKGAYFTAEFFPTEKAQEIRNIVKSGVLWQFSFAYDTLDAGKIKAGDGSEVNELRELELYEISIVMVPANPRATITDIKGVRQNDRKNNLLRFIDDMNKERKENLLQAVEEAGRNLPEDKRPNPVKEELARMKNLEAQCLKDIGEAEAKGKTEWKEQRKNALAAIRRTISQLEKRI